MRVNYVKIAAVTAAVLLRATVGYASIILTVVVGTPWGGYAYDYFAEDYTVVS